MLLHSYFQLPGRLSGTSCNIHGSATGSVGCDSVMAVLVSGNSDGGGGGICGGGICDEVCMGDSGGRGGVDDRGGTGDKGSSRIGGKIVLSSDDSTILEGNNG